MCDKIITDKNSPVPLYGYKEMVQSPCGNLYSVRTGVHVPWGQFTTAPVFENREGWAARPPGVTCLPGTPEEPCEFSEHNQGRWACFRDVHRISSCFSAIRECLERPPIESYRIISAETVSNLSVTKVLVRVEVRGAQLSMFYMDRIGFSTIPSLLATEIMPKEIVCIFDH